ncbi:MAG: 4Fe-4S binding protein [Candidatus Orphnella occulta]|nr:4Fe-4S binding protein [Candidatus Orphnella occulta]
MAKITIDQERCKGCGLCVIYCPHNCIISAENINKRGVKPAIFKRGAKCVGCTLCAVICPDNAIEVYK